jgi:hypothetical protein
MSQVPHQVLFLWVAPKVHRYRKGKEGTGPLSGHHKWEEEPEGNPNSSLLALAAQLLLA